MRLNIRERAVKGTRSDTTRIEIKSEKMSRSLTLEMVDVPSLYDHLYTQLGGYTSRVQYIAPITETPLRYVMKSSIQIYNIHGGSTKKVDFKSFTCYGVDADELYKLVHDEIICVE